MSAGMYLASRGAFARLARAIRCPEHGAACAVAQTVGGVVYAVCKAAEPWHVVTRAAEPESDRRRGGERDGR